MSKFKFALNLQLFSDEGSGDTGVDNVSAAETHTEVETGDNTGAADQSPNNNIEKAFAKRLAAKEAEWNKKLEETTSKYKDYDRHSKASSFLMKQSGFQSMDELYEAIEREELRERAETQGISPEMQKRLDELEQKASKFDEFQQQQARFQETQQFENSLKEFLKDKMLGEKPVDHMDLWKFMEENQIGKPEAAFKAMKAEFLEKQLEEAQKEGMKKVLQAKGNIPPMSGSKSGAQVSAPAPKTMAEARARAMARLNGELN